MEGLAGRRCDRSATMGAEALASSQVSSSAIGVPVPAKLLSPVATVLALYARVQ